MTNTEGVEVAITRLEEDIRETREYLGERLDKQDSRIDSIYNWTVIGLWGIIAAILMASAGIIAAVIATGK